MPKYLILPAEALRQLTLAEANTSDPSAAIQSVDPSVRLPGRVAVVPCEDIVQVIVMEQDDEEVVVVPRSDGVAASGLIIPAGGMQTEQAPVEPTPRDDAIGGFGEDPEADLVPADESPFEEPIGNSDPN